MSRSANEVARIAHGVRCRGQTVAGSAMRWQIGDLVAQRVPGQ